MLRILEVAIGLALVFTLVALISSLLNEWLSAMLEKRGNLLWEGIENLVDTTLRDDICAHQLMQGLVRNPTWFDTLLKRLLPWVDRSKPSYVPTEVFVAALLDIIGSRAAGNPEAIGQLPTTFTDLQTAITKAQGVPDKVKKALLALVNDAGTDLAGAKKSIGDWFDAGMGRVTGWYKRWSQMVLLVVSLIVAVVLGVDSIGIAQRLWSDPMLRDQVTQAAADFVRDNPDLPQPTPEALAKQRIEEIQIFRGQLEALTLPLYPASRLAEEYRQAHPAGQASWLDKILWWLRLHAFGFLLTGLAASLGAPFWFDLLNKLVNLRNTGTRHAGRLQSGQPDENRGSRAG